MRERKKLLMTAGGIAVLVILAVFLIKAAVSSGNEAEYRSILVSQISGSVQIEREQTGTLDAYAGMMLQSEDVICTGEDGYLYLKLDEDKYVMIEPLSRARLVSSGNEQDSRTSIYMEEGAIVNRLDTDLSEKSIYEINTPNSTMAVRGTNFRVQMIRDENGVSHTYVFVFEGTVNCWLVFPDGSVQQETPVTGGNQVQIRGDEQESSYVALGEPVDYEELPAEVLDFLLTAVKEGVPIPITQEELEDLIKERTEGDGEEKEKEKESPAPAREEEVKEPTPVGAEGTKEPTSAKKEGKESPYPTPTKEPEIVREEETLPTASPVPTPTMLPEPVVTEPEENWEEDDTEAADWEEEDDEEEEDSVSEKTDSGKEEAPTEPPIPTDKPNEDGTDIPIELPTQTPVPTETPTPTATPTATPTPTPTATPTPTPTPTATPISDNT